jgi:hypothetical protein
MAKDTTHLSGSGVKHQSATTESKKLRQRDGLPKSTATQNDTGNF